MDFSSDFAFAISRNFRIEPSDFWLKPFDFSAASSFGLQPFDFDASQIKPSDSDVSFQNFRIRICLLF